MTADDINGFDCDLILFCSEASIVLEKSTANNTYKIAMGNDDRIRLIIYQEPIPVLSLNRKSTKNITGIGLSSNMSVSKKFYNSFSLNLSLQRLLLNFTPFPLERNSKSS